MVTILLFQWKTCSAVATQKPNFLKAIELAADFMVNLDCFKYKEKIVTYKMD